MLSEPTKIRKPVCRHCAIAYNEWRPSVTLTRHLCELNINDIGARLTDDRWRWIRN